MLTENTTITADLIEAYRETDYLVFSDPLLKLKVDEHHPGLADLHANHGVDCSAFLTAWNPSGGWASLEENSSRMAALMGSLERRGIELLPALGRHPTSGRGGEGSLLALGLALEEAKNLAIIYQQDAIVWTGKDAIPRLVLLR